MSRLVILLLLMCVLIGYPPAGAQQKASPSPGVKVVADPRTNSVIIYTTEKKAEQAKKVIKKLDDGARETKGEGIYIYYLKHAKATEMAELLRKILVDP